MKTSLNLKMGIRILTFVGMLLILVLTPVFASALEKDSMKASSTQQPGSITEQSAASTTWDEAFYSSNKMSVENILARYNGKSMKDELIENRSMYGKAFALDDNKQLHILSVLPQHYEDQYGKLQDIDTRLVDQLSYKQSRSDSAEMLGRLDRQEGEESSYYLAPHVPFGVQIAKQFEAGYAVKKGEHELIVTPVDGKPVIGKLTGKSTILYEEAWNDTDVMLEVTETGLKETLILHSSSSPTIFSYKLSQSLDENLSLGEIQLAPAWLIDAKDVYRDVKQQIRVEEEATWLDLIVDTDNLAFPITVDPTFNLVYPARAEYKAEKISPTIWKYTLTYTPYPSIGTIVNANGYPSTSYGLLKFDLTGIPGNRTVTNAYLENIDPDNKLIHPPEKIIQPWVDNAYLSTQYWGTLTQFVQGWINGETNYGLRYRSNQLPSIFGWMGARLVVEIEPTNAPNNLKVEKFTKNTVTIKWTEPDLVTGLTGYKVYRNNQLAGTLGASNKSFTLQNTGTGLHQIYVTALFGSVESDPTPNLDYTYRGDAEYIYNTKNQLIEIRYPYNIKQQLIYDANGNLTSIQRIP